MRSWPKMAAGYLVPVNVKPCSDPSRGSGVFATAPVKKGTLLWQPDQVKAVPAEQITADLAAMPHDDAHVRLMLQRYSILFLSFRLLSTWRGLLQVLLRQSFVAPSNAEALCINPSDNGRFTNHSATPNVGACVDHSNDSYALQDIAEGDELTCDYSGFVTPDWYKQLCKKYEVLTTQEVVELSAKQV